MARYIKAEYVKVEGLSAPFAWAVYHDGHFKKAFAELDGALKMAHELEFDSGYPHDSIKIYRLTKVE